jgi:imidazolonepropionase-like amidohydrolase
MAALAAAPMSAAVTAIRNVTVIDGTGAPALPHTTIIVRGERIAGMGPAAKLAVPKGARVVEGRGRFAIPGLWDMHVHLWYPQNQLPVYVANGITGVRDMGSDYAQLEEWRRDAESGKTIGPHVVTSGPPVAGKASEDKKLPVMVAITPEDARRVFDKLDEMDVDFIKILSDLPRDAFIALSERARKWRMPFAGHVPNSVTVLEAIDARMGSMEHLFGWFAACSSEEANIRAGKTPSSRAVGTFDEKKARELFKRSALFETRQVPTLTLWERITYAETASRVHDPRLRYVPRAIRATWPSPEEELKAAASPDLAPAREQLELAFRMVKLMRESDVEIMAGTDTGDPYTIPGVTLQRELELLVKAGLTPIQALQSATLIPARYLYWDQSLGTLKPGMLADIVLLDADPLANIRNVARVSGVAIRGRYLDKPQLTAILNAVK